MCIRDRFSNAKIEIAGSKFISFLVPSNPAHLHFAPVPSWGRDKKIVEGTSKWSNGTRFPITELFYVQWKLLVKQCLLSYILLLSTYIYSKKPVDKISYIFNYTIKSNPYPISQKIRNKKWLDAFRLDSAIRARIPLNRIVPRLESSTTGVGPKPPPLSSH